MDKIGPAPDGASRPRSPRSLELPVRSGLLQAGGSTWWLRRVRLYADPLAHRFRAYATLERRDMDALNVDADPLGVELVGEGASVEAATAALATELLTSPLLEEPEEIEDARALLASVANRWDEVVDLFGGAGS